MRTHFTLLLLFFSCVAFSQRSEKKFAPPDSFPAVKLWLADSLEEIDQQVLVRLKGKALADSLVAFAEEFKGDRYRRGGTGARGFDCSGFTLVVYRRFGIKLPHTSQGQSLLGVKVPIPQIQKGDLLFFRSRSRRSKRIGHVGIVISEKGEPVRFIHSSTSHGVRVDYLEAEYYKKRFMKAARVLPFR